MQNKKDVKNLETDISSDVIGIGESSLVGAKGYQHLNSCAPGWWHTPNDGRCDGFTPIVW
jgi:hypothetical protein